MTEAAAVPMPDFKALRNEAIQKFIEENGWGGSPMQPLVDQASPRVYYRLAKDGKTCVFLDSPNPTAPQERLANVIAYSTILNKIGLRAPQVFAADLEKGFALIEDFGDTIYTVLFDKGEDKEPYLQDAMDALIHLHRHLDPNDMPQLGNDLDYFTWENPYFTNWYWPARYGHETPPDIAMEYLALWKKLLTDAPSLPKTMCMTDYHAPNLMLLPDKKGIERVGIIDIQDSLLASPVYDVMSLLEDDRRLLDEDAGIRLKNRYRDAMRATIDPEIFDLHYALYSAQRHAKNMGNFVRIAVTKRAPVWLEYIPVATHWFHRALHSHPYLTPMQKWFARHCPDYQSPLPPVRLFKE